MARLTQQDFQKLLEFRVALREFQRWSEDQAEAAALTHVQHQLLVAIKGHPGDQLTCRRRPGRLPAVATA